MWSETVTVEILQNRVRTLEDEKEYLLKELTDLTTFLNNIRAAHQEHLRTGDYMKLGMAAQDALRLLEAM